MTITGLSLEDMIDAVAALVRRGVQFRACKLDEKSRPSLDNTWTITLTGGY